MNEQLLAASGGRGVGHGQRNAEHGVGPEPALVRRAVELDQPGVEAGLIVQIHPSDRRGDQPGHVLDRPEDAQAAVARVVGVAQLERLVPAGARPRGHDRPPDRPVEAIASTSTVGRPRESSTWRALSPSRSACRLSSPSLQPNDLDAEHPMSAARSKSLAGERARDGPGLGVEVFDRALAVDAGQAAGRRVQDGSTDQLGASRPARALGVQVGAQKARDQADDIVRRLRRPATTARIALSRRWVRKNPRSKAGSPAWAHSKSSRIRPPDAPGCSWG